MEKQDYDEYYEKIQKCHFDLFSKHLYNAEDNVRRNCEGIPWLSPEEREELVLRARSKVVKTFKRSYAAMGKCTSSKNSSVNLIIGKEAQPGEAPDHRALSSNKIRRGHALCIVHTPARIEYSQAYRKKGRVRKTCLDGPRRRTLKWK